MKLPYIIKSPRLTGYKVLAIAVFFSLAWHLFWLSVIKIIPAKSQPAQAKFSRVSFLGPILSKVSLGIRSEPEKRSFLETRYGVLADKAVRAWPSPDLPVRGKGSEDDSAGDVDRKMPYLVGDAVSGLKVEPEQSSE